MQKSDLSKMIKDTSSKRVGIDLNALTSYINEKIPENDIRRVLKKISSEMSLKNLHAVAQTIDISNVQESSLGMMECMREYLKWIKEGANTRHPVYAVDNLVASNDVRISPTEIVGSVEVGGELRNVTLTNKLGVYCSNDNDRRLAVASTLIASSTTRLDNGVVNIFSNSLKLEFFGMQTINLREVRNMFQDDTKSSTVARDAIYASLKADDLLSHILVDMTYKDIPYGEPIAEVKNYVNACVDLYNKMMVKRGKQPLKYTAVGKPPGAYDINIIVKDFVTFDYVSTVSNMLTQIIGDSEKGRGGVSSIYYYGEITAAWHKVFCRYQEIRHLLSMYKSNVVRLPANSKVYGSNLIRTLVKNGIVVLSDNATGVFVPGVDKESGHFRYTEGSSIEVVSSPFSAPVFKKLGAEYVKADVFKKEMDTFKYGTTGIRLCLAKMTPALWDAFKNKEIGLIPSTAAASCKMWVSNVYKAQDENFVMENVHRMLKMVHKKAKFIVNRYPAYFSDDYRQYFSYSCTIPKTDQKEIKNTVEKSAFSVGHVSAIQSLNSEAYGEHGVKSYAALDHEDIAKVKLDEMLAKTSIQDQVRYWNAVLADESDEVIDAMQKSGRMNAVLDIIEELQNRDDADRIIVKTPSAPMSEPPSEKDPTSDLDSADLELLQRLRAQADGVTSYIATKVSEKPG